MSPAEARYVVTARDPGARLVFTVGPTVRPRATALRASSPAPTMTVGLDVFVHDVIAAIATDPTADVDVPATDLDRHGLVFLPALRAGGSGDRRDVRLAGAGLGPAPRAR